MERKFYDRFNELDLLKEKFDNLKKGEFGVLYGRRRVGKTELLRRFANKTRCKRLVLTITFQSRAELKRALSRKIEECFKEVVKINDWEDFFEYIIEKTKDEKFLLIFDEFQELDKFAKDFIRSLQKYWDDKLRVSKVMLIISGSSMSMMHRLALEEKGPLYGRKTFTIPLKQFKYIDFREMFKELSEEEKIKLFSVFGGTPKYLTDFKESGLDLIESLKSLVLSDKGALYNEPINALKFELKNPERYISILRAISKGKKELKEISDYLELEQYQLTPYLRNLSELLDIISQSNPLYGKMKMKRYEIKDNFFKFWYRFVYPFQEQIQAGITEPSIKRIYKEMDDFVGRIFEDIATEFFIFMRGKKIKGMSIDFLEYGKWWEAGEDIDLVLKNKGATIFVEVKFQTKKMNSRNFEELKEKSLKTSAKGTFKYILISKSGFEQELIDRKIQNLVLLDLNDLTKITDEETKREKEMQCELSEWFGLSN